MNINIELKGYGKAGKKVCDNCPCFCSDACSSHCGMDYWQPDGCEYSNGIANTETGEVIVDPHNPDDYVCVDGWVTAYIRPQICIDNHGE